MIPSDTAVELQERLGYAINSFGSIQNFLDLIKIRFHLPITTNFLLFDNQNAPFLEMLKELFIYKDSVVIISPWAYTFALRNSDNPNLEEAIGLNIPYKVYHPNGNLLYSVKSHQGIFGNSILDKALITNFSSTAYFYLRYSNYYGDPKFKILLLNHYSTKLIRTNQFTNIKVRSTQEETIISTILFNFINPINVQDSYSIYFLKSVPDNIPTTNEVLSNQFTDVVTYAASEQILYTLQTAGWLVVTKNGVPLQLNDPTGQGVNKIIRQGLDIMYIGIGITTDVLRQTFNTSVVRAEFNSLSAEVEVIN